MNLNLNPQPNQAQLHAYSCDTWHRWFSARLQYLQCVSNWNSAILHETIDIWIPFSLMTGLSRSWSSGHGPPSKRKNPPSTAAFMLSSVVSTPANNMMTSRHGDANYWPFVRGIHQWLLDSTNKRPVMPGLLFYFFVSPNRLLKWRIELPMIWDAVTIMWRHCNEQVNTESCNSLMPQSHHTPGSRTGCSRAVPGMFLNKNRTSTHGARTSPVVVSIPLHVRKGAVRHPRGSRTGPVGYEKHWRSPCRVRTMPRRASHGAPVESCELFNQTISVQTCQAVRGP